MVMTAGDVVTKTRKYLSDDNQIQIYSDLEMIDSLNRALIKLRRDRPDLSVSDGGTMILPATVDELTDELRFPDDFLEALSQYSAYDKLSDDSHDRADRDEAAYRLGLYQQEIRN